MYALKHVFENDDEQRREDEGLFMMIFDGDEQKEGRKHSIE